jgi:hypothetical protein
VYLCVFCGYKNKQRLFLYTALIDRLLVESLGEADVMHLKTPPSDTQNQPQCHPLPPAARPNTPLPSTVPSTLTKELPCYQLTFTRRTIGQCLWTFRETNPSDSLCPPPPVITISAMPHTAPPPHFLVFLFWYSRALSARQLRSVCLLLCDDQMKNTMSWPCNTHGRIQSGHALAQPAYWDPATGDFLSAKAMER